MPNSQQIILYSRKEVAAFAKVCVHTIARDVRAGRLEEIRFNRRRLRYHRNAVEAYLAANFRLDWASADSPNTATYRKR